MKKWLIFVLLILFLVSCEKQIEEQQSADQIKELYNAQEAKKIVDKQLGLDKNVEEKVVDENKQFSEPINVVEELSHHSCAVFSEKDSLKFCSMPYEASKFFENELHDTCTQQFRSEGLPYNYVNIRSLRYHDKIEAEKKLRIDVAVYQGIFDEKNKKLFWKTGEGGRIAEFLIGSRIVRISETSVGVCERFEDLVKTAFARGG